MTYWKIDISQNILAFIKKGIGFRTQPHLNNGKYEQHLLINQTTHGYKWTSNPDGRHTCVSTHCLFLRYVWTSAAREMGENSSATLKPVYTEVGVWRGSAPVSFSDTFPLVTCPSQRDLRAVRIQVDNLISRVKTCCSARAPWRIRDPGEHIGKCENVGTFSFLFLYHDVMFHNGNSSPPIANNSPQDPR